jgi:hypothetical protein
VEEARHFFFWTAAETTGRKGTKRAAEGKKLAQNSKKNGRRKGRTQKKPPKKRCRKCGVDRRAKFYKKRAVGTHSTSVKEARTWTTWTSSERFFSVIAGSRIALGKKMGMQKL